PAIPRQRTSETPSDPVGTSSRCIPVGNPRELGRMGIFCDGAISTYDGRLGKPRDESRDFGGSRKWGGDPRKRTNREWTRVDANGGTRRRTRPQMNAD